MRIVADSDSYNIIQVEKTPDVGEYRPFNGRFMLPIPDGSSVDVDINTYILPQDGGDLAATSAAALLARFPMYSHIFYNFLLEDTDIADLDLSPLPAVSTLGGFTARTRVMTGRGVGPGALGQVPNTTTILPLNDKTVPNRPGMLITDTVDIGPVTGGVGADEFMMWWQILEFNTTHDIASDFGIYNGDNIPSSRQVAETDQEPAGFGVYISHDDGVTWVSIGRIEPTDLTVFDKDVRVAFVNLTNTAYRLAAYAVMF